MPQIRDGASDCLEKTTFLIIDPDGKRTSGVVRWPKTPTFDQISETVRPLLQANRDGAQLERVAVLHDGEPVDMFVDQASGLFPELPENEYATKIYHAASVARGRDLTNAPKIYGRAILFSRRVWF